MAHDTSLPEPPPLGTQTTYDETPYPSSPFPQTHPEKIGALGRLFGLPAADLARSRVLELGCADGANLLPMAQHAPEAFFLGIDASAKQVSAAHAAIAGAGLSNVEIRCQNILDFPADAGAFDYIIVHGIFSWVPDPVRDKILAICRDHLTENGIAYVSYNAFPGWGMRTALRDMLLFHTRGFADSKTKVAQARALTAFLSEAVPTEGNPYGLLLKQELERMKKSDDNYMRHDILEEENRPFYFHEFATRAATAGLQYLSETSLDQMLASNFPAQVVKTLGQINGNLVAQEQYMDFIRNRNFRQTLLCRHTAPLRRDIDPSSMKGFYFTSSLAKPDRSQLNLAPGMPYGFKMRTGDAVVTSDHSLVKAAFDTLADRTLDRISFTELLDLAREKSAPFLGSDPSGTRADDESTVLARNLLHLYTRGFVDIFTASVPVTLSVPQKPNVSPLTRYQALHSRLVTSRAHIGLKFDVASRYVLSACDGTRSVDGIVDFLVETTRSGKLNVAEEGQPVRAEPRLRELLAHHARAYLAMIASHGFFAAEPLGARGDAHLAVSKHT